MYGYGFPYTSLFICGTYWADKTWSNPNEFEIQSARYGFEEQEHKYSLKFGNVLIFHPDTDYRSVIPQLWKEALRVLLSLGCMKKLAHL